MSTTIKKRQKFRRAVNTHRVSIDDKISYRLSPEAYVKRYEEGTLQNVSVRFVPPKFGGKDYGHFVVVERGRRFE